MNTQLKITLAGVAEMVNFPSSGQILDIESLKMALTNGTYGNMVRASGQGSVTSTRALDIVDTIATFSILLPELKKRLGLVSYDAMPLKLATELSKAYKDVYYPWFTALEKEMTEVAVTAAEDFEALKEEKKGLQENV